MYGCAQWANIIVSYVYEVFYKVVQHSGELWTAKGAGGLPCLVWIAKIHILKQTQELFYQTVVGETPAGVSLLYFLIYVC